MRTSTRSAAAYRRVRIGTLAAVLAVAVAACGSGDTGGVTAGDGGSKGPIKIGLNLEMSGVASTLGPHALIAAEMARDEINAAGGIDGRKIEFVLKDNRSTPEQATIAVTDLVREDVVAIIGPVQSTQAAVAFPASNRAKVVSMSPGSAKPGLTAANRPWAFRNALLDNLVAQGVVRELVKREGIKRTGIVVDGRDAYSNNYGNVVLPAALKANKVEIATVIESKSGQRDFSVEVTSLKQAGVDSVALNTLFEDGAVFLKEAERQQLNVPIYGGASMAVPQTTQLAGAAADGAYAGSTFVASLELPDVQAFVTEYEKRAKAALPSGAALLPGYIDAGTYETVKMIGSAFAGKPGSGSVDDERVAVRDYLAKLEGYKGLGTDISINEEGDVIKPIFVLQVTGGQFQKVAEVEVS